MRARQEADCGAPTPKPAPCPEAQEPRRLHPQHEKATGQRAVQTEARQTTFIYRSRHSAEGNLIPSKGFTDKLHVRLGNSYTQVTTPLPQKLLAGVSLRLPDTVRPRALREACLALSAADRPLGARGGPPPPPSSGQQPADPGQVCTPTLWSSELLRANTASKTTGGIELV